MAKLAKARGCRAIRICDRILNFSGKRKIQNAPRSIEWHDFSSFCEVLLYGNMALQRRKMPEGACFVQGAKNAVLPILAASVVCQQKQFLLNVPT